MNSSKTEKLIEIMKTGTIAVPKYIFFNYRRLGMNEEEFIVMMYFLNGSDLLLLNPKIFAEELDMDAKKLLQVINSLSEKQFISIKVLKNKIGITEERISLAAFYNKLSTFMIDQINITEEVVDTNLFQIFENEFGRTLSPMEYEIINGWMKEQFSTDIIVEALKEATFNGVSSLRYIDKILYEWKKKGFKTVADVRKQQSRFKEKKENVEVFDYDWLDGDL